MLALRTTYLQALRSSVFAGCSPCVVFMRRIYFVRHICTPCSSYLQALCIIFAALMQHICRPCAAYLQAAPYSQALLCIRVVGPVQFCYVPMPVCSICAGPGPVHHTCRPCFCAAYAHPVQHICSPLCIIFAFTLQALWHQHHTCRLLDVIGGWRTTYWLVFG